MAAGADLPAPRRELLRDVAHGVVVREQLNLPRAVEQHVLPGALGRDLLLEPVEVLLEILHAIYESAIRAQPELLHGVFQGNQLHHVDRAIVGQHVVPRVQIHNHCVAAGV